MNISTILSALKVIEKMLKFLNDIELHMHVYYHYTYNMHGSLLCNDNTGIHEYSPPSPLVNWHLVYVVSIGLMLQSMLHL